MILFYLLLALLAIWIFMMAPRLNRPPLLKKLQTYRFAHRGLHDIEKGIPENSILAFRLAMEQGFGMELDVHLSKDGKLVVEHDDSLRRTCGVPRPIEVCDWDEIKDLRLEGTNETLPLLEDVLSLVQGRVPLLIEAKVFGGNYNALCAAIYQALKGYQGDFCIESFDPRAVGWFAKNAPEIVRGQLSGHRLKQNKIIDFAMRHLLIHCISRPDFLAYDYQKFGIAYYLFRALFGAPIFLWTIRTKEAKAVAKEQGATPIFEKQGV